MPRFLGSWVCWTILALLAVENRAHAQSDGEGAVPRGTTGAVPRKPADEGPAKPALTLPELLHFESAPYPEQAQAQGVQADVVLKLTIDREGNVTAAEVSQAAGNGFDEAARVAALKFRFRPATRAGRPVPAQILYKYSFTLTPVAPPPEAAVPQTGELSGALRISGTDTPLAGSEVLVTLPDGSERSVTTDTAGRFRLSAVPPGRYRLRVRTEGFRPLENQEEVAVGQATEVVYRVVAEATGIEIIVEGERPLREVTRRTVERREIERIPGTGGDALRSIQSLPGVGRPPGFSGLLIVRGSAPEDTNVFVDGTLTPLIYHFGGLSSVIPTELLERIDFYPGNFSARYGRVSGGIIDVGLRAPDTRCTEDYGKPSQRSGCYHGLLQLDLIDARTLIQGPIGSSRDWSFALAGRRSWVDAWAGPLLESTGASVTSAPVYYDYQAIVERKRGKSRLSLRAYGADDRLEIIVKDPAAEDPAFGGNLTLGTAYYRVQALYEDDLTSAVSLRSMLSAGKNTVDFGLGNLLFNIALYPIYGRHEFGFRLAEGVKANFGLDFLFAPYDLIIRAPPEVPRPGEPDAGPISSTPVREQREKSSVFRPAWYTELELTPTRRLRVVPGARVDYARDSGHADFSPRINARYDLVTPASAEEQASGVSRGRTTIKGGIGLFYQPPDFQETDSVFGTPNLESNRAVHYALGVEQELGRQIELGVEGFYKDLSQQVSRSSADNGLLYENLGQGYVVGVETLLKYKPDARFFGWVSYTLSRSVRQDGPDEEEFLFQYDQTHNLVMLGSYRLGRGWEFGARFRVVSGPLDTPAVSRPALPAIYNADAGAYVPLQGEPFSRRLPLFHQLDLRVDKRWQFRTWRFSTYLDIQNTYSNAAVEGLTYNYDFSQQSYQTGIPIIPSLGMRGEF